MLDPLHHDVSQLAHRKKLKINTILIGIVTVLLMICGISKIKIPLGYMVLDFIGEWSLELAQRVYLPGFIYRETEPVDSFGEWIVSKTEKIVPLGAFVNEHLQG